MDRREEYWDILINYGIATEGEIQLVTDINGYTEQALLDILFARTAYHDFEQYTWCEHVK